MAERVAENAPGASRSAGKWVIVILLSVIAACLLIEVGLRTPHARAATGSGGKAGIFAVAGQITRDTYGIYLVDAEGGTICLYEYVPSAHKLHLRAARNVTFDLRLDAYNTEPTPQEIKKLVEQHRRLKAKSGQ